jgi:hypothetical protein
MTPEDTKRYHEAEEKILAALSDDKSKYSKLFDIADTLEVPQRPEALAELIWQVFLTGKRAGREQLKKEIMERL